MSNYVPSQFYIFVETALKKNTLTPYVALAKANPQEFPRNLAC